MNDQHTPLDTATRDRLNRLGSMPVDLAGLEAKLADNLPGKAAPRPAVIHRIRASGWLRVAAVLAVMLGVASAAYVGFFGITPQTATAQTLTVSELHHYLIGHPDAAYRARNASEAQRGITAQLAGQQSVPVLRGARVESCCLVEGDFPLRAALVVDRPEGMVTIIIAQGKDFAHQMNPIAHPSGVSLQGHEHAGMPMVMRNNGDLWMCVMGRVDQAVLADLAAGLAL